jgi:A/G-specific adenine glycosylase
VDGFAQQLLAWFECHGRHDLPWQQEPTPYRVWVSEVMLQQTQVATVIPYFERFMGRFPDLRSLAGAELDEVLAHWSGLGYYSRARNLHRAARLVRDEHGGRFPESIAAALALPGIGRSTAGAILALACGQHHPILDGNVKRVLGRYHAVGGWYGRREVAEQLWQLAEAHTPSGRTADYTQAIMDLGATLCSRSRPACQACPVAGGCEAYKQGRVAEFPGRKPRKALPSRTVLMPVAVNGRCEVLLQKRPPSGIWGGLWSLPECDDAAALRSWCERHLPGAVEAAPMAPLKHTFSHFQLHIEPRHMVAGAAPGQIADGGALAWHPLSMLAQLGVPAPVRRILDQLVAGDVQ